MDTCPESAPNALVPSRPAGSTGVPIAAHGWAQRHAPGHVGLITGLAFGTIADPLTLAVYGLGMIVPPLLLPGLLLAHFHGAPGYNLALVTHLIRAGVVIDLWTPGFFWTSFLSAAVWTPIYGTAGWLWDRRGRGGT